MKMVAAIAQLPGIAPENRYARDLNSRMAEIPGGGWRRPREVCPARAGSRRPEGVSPLSPRLVQHNYVADLSGETCAKPESAPNWGRNQPRPGAKRAGAPLGNRNAAKGWRKTRSRPSPEFTAFNLKVADFIRRAREAIAVADVLAAEREALRPPRQLIHTIRVTHIRDGVVVQDRIVQRIVSLKRSTKRFKRAPVASAWHEGATPLGNRRCFAVGRFSSNPKRHLSIRTMSLTSAQGSHERIASY